MAESRPPLSASQSFVVPSESPDRPTLKRRLFSSPELFSPAETTFNPRPYAPNNSLFRRRSSSRPPFVSTVSTEPMPGDTDAQFIQSPFTSFPDCEKHNYTLTYSLLAQHPDWFLLVSDFISKENTDPRAIPYPPELEPPRGWCPTKRKDLQELGSDNLSEGQEVPRLRCTFCRRFYAGVNAKSMWRRHVYEKHKIAMSNRRDTTNDPPRGRGSNKENKRTSLPRKTSGHESIIDVDIVPQTEPFISSQRLQFSAVDNARSKRAQVKVAKGRSKSPMPETSVGEKLPNRDANFSPPTSSYSQPSTPQGKRKVYDVPLPSPYDPLRTPDFRHSPQRLPLNQPWRYASPSNPSIVVRSVSLNALNFASPKEPPLLKKTCLLAPSPESPEEDLFLVNRSSQESSFAGSSSVDSFGSIKDNPNASHSNSMSSESLVSVDDSSMDELCYPPPQTSSPMAVLYSGDSPIARITASPTKHSPGHGNSYFFLRDKKTLHALDCSLSSEQDLFQDFTPTKKRKVFA